MQCQNLFNFLPKTITHVSPELRAARNNINNLENAKSSPNSYMDLGSDEVGRGGGGATWRPKN
jgi:hypothetical protein